MTRDEYLGLMYKPTGPRLGLTPRLNMNNRPVDLAQYFGRGAGAAADSGAGAVNPSPPSGSSQPNDGGGGSNNDGSQGPSASPSGNSTYGGAVVSDSVAAGLNSAGLAGIASGAQTGFGFGGVPGAVLGGAAGYYRGKDDAFAAMMADINRSPDPIAALANTMGWSTIDAGSPPAPDQVNESVNPNGTTSVSINGSTYSEKGPDNSGQPAGVGDPGWGSDIGRDNVGAGSPGGGGTGTGTGTDGGDGDGYGGGGDGSDGQGDGHGGYYKGGRVTKNSLAGPDPKGPDDGYAALDSNEFVLKASTAKRLGFTKLKALNEGRADIVMKGR